MRYFLILAAAFFLFSCDHATPPVAAAEPTATSETVEKPATLQMPGLAVYDRTMMVVHFFATMCLIEGSVNAACMVTAKDCVKGIDPSNKEAANKTIACANEGRKAFTEQQP